MIIKSRFTNRHRSTRRSSTVHRDDCPSGRAYSDRSTARRVSEGDAREAVREGWAQACGRCRPFDGRDTDTETRGGERE